MTHGTGWLQISTEGFASFNQARPPGHLVKELVQNALDAIGEAPGEVDLDYGAGRDGVVVVCRDDGSGLEDLAALRVVYLTFKTDSHLKRGRFGRGFKEILSVARTATVESGMHRLDFLVEDGQQVTRAETCARPLNGTRVCMLLPWGPDVVEDFDPYFARFLVPADVSFRVNGRPMPPRAPRHRVPATLFTEVYHPDSHSWRKPRRATTIELVPVISGEEPFIYEMGIPVASAEWSVPFHANVLQRVPMNPNRDALASGYAKGLHTACLPILLPDLDAEATTADWVGTAGTRCDEAIQKEILRKAFGDTAVRSVPPMGKRDFDHDAERLGAAIVRTSQMSAGFREMAKAHLPSARESVVAAEEVLARTIAETSFAPADVKTHTDDRQTWIARRGGSAHVERCLGFAVWFCQCLLDSTGTSEPRVTGAVALGERGEVFGTKVDKFLAHWSSSNRLTLALEVDAFWQAPLGAESLAILVHEAAHARNMHHAKSFHEEVERLAGVAAALMFAEGASIRRQWPDLVARSQVL